MDLRIIALVVELINTTGQPIKFRRRVHGRELDHPERYLWELPDVKPGATLTVDKNNIFNLARKLRSPYWELDVYIGDKFTGVQLNSSHFEHNIRLVFAYDENQAGEKVFCLDVVKEEKKDTFWGLEFFGIGRDRESKWGKRPKTRIYPTPAPSPGDNDDLSRQGETDDGHPSSSASPSPSPSADEISTSESMPRNSQRLSSFADATITKSVSMACGSQQFSPSADVTTGNRQYQSSEAEETSHDQKGTMEIEMCSVIPPTNLKEHGTEFQSTTVSKDDQSNSLTHKRGLVG